MIEVLKKLFRPRLTGRQINMWEHIEWGDAIHWLSYQKRRMYGHMAVRPRKGDVINCCMNSGKIGQFIVIKVKYEEDPPDMFFCDVSDLGYRE